MKLRNLLAVVAASLLLAACLPLGVISVAAAKSGITGDCTWTLDDDGHLTISGNGAMADYASWLDITSCEDSIPWGDEITSLTIEDGVTTIGEYAFPYCDSLTSVTIADSVTTIGVAAFVSCDALTSVTIPNSVAIIGDNAFIACQSLRSVTIPDGVITIGDAAFDYCTSLTSVNIPATVTTIGESAFNDCSALTTIKVNQNNPNYCDVDGVLFNKDKTALIQFPTGKVGGYTIPDSVTTLGEYAFSRCPHLTAIEVDENNPNYCDVDGVLFSKDKTTLLRYPGSKAGAYTIPDSVTAVDYSAFYDCPALTAIEVDKNNPNYCDVDGVLFSKGNVELIQCPGGKVGTFTIPNDVCFVNRSAFHYCTALTKVTIPGKGFYIGPAEFENCTGLTSVIIEEGFPEINESDFYGCTALTSVVLPISVTSIGDSAFYDCPSLTDIYYAGTQEDKANIAIEGGNEYLLNATWHYQSKGPNLLENIHIDTDKMSEDKESAQADDPSESPSPWLWMGIGGSVLLTTAAVTIALFLKKKKS